MSDSASTPLVGKCLMLVRPLRQPDKLAELLEQAGATVVKSPIQQIQLIANPQLPELDGSAGLIVVSRQAAVALLESYTIDELRRSPIYAVGRETAEFMQQRGLSVSYPEQPNSEGLLALPELDQVDGKRFLIAKGEGGRELLEQALSSRGARVENIVLYRRVADMAGLAYAITQLADQPIDAVLAHSVEAVELLAAAAVDCTLIAAGQRVADAARTAGINDVVAAKNALPECFLEATVVALATAHQ